VCVIHLLVSCVVPLQSRAVKRKRKNQHHILFMLEMGRDRKVILQNPAKNNSSLIWCIQITLSVCCCFAEPRVLRIETKQVPRPSQAEVVLSDG
jgi:hypothetical protein